MGIKVKTNKTKKFVMRPCTTCGELLGEENYLPTNSPFYPDGHVPMCDSCIDSYLKESNYSWDKVDEICRYMNIPFIPKEWDNNLNENKVYPFNVYCKKMSEAQYEGINWKTYFDTYVDLQNGNALEQELPLIDELQKKQLRARWGSNYDDEALLYLENLYQNTLATQNISSALQADGLLRLCKMNYEADNKIRAGQDIDKIIRSIDTQTKSLELTPKNSKNLNDFDTIGELIKWFEKRGWRFNYYDNVSRDVVDETMKNIQNFNQKLYVNEVGIGEEITRRIERLKSIASKEDSSAADDNYYETQQEFDSDAYDNEGYTNLINGDFDASIMEDGSYGPSN